MNNLMSRDVKTELIQIRISKADKEKIKNFADDRFGISEFMINSALTQIKEQTEGKPPITDDEIDKAIAFKIVSDALALNYTVSVFDSEEWCLKRSSNQKEIMDSLNSTGWDQLKFRNSEGEYIGVVALIWSNGRASLISDYTLSPEMEKLMQGANDLADKYSD